MTLQEHLASLGACKEAREWAADKPAKEVWDTCPRADWMLWWAARTPANSKQDIVRVAAAIARTVLHLVPAGEDRPRLAIEAAEAWADSPTAENTAKAKLARHAAAAAAYAAAAAAAAAAYAAAAAAAAAADAAAAYAAAAADAAAAAAAADAAAAYAAAAAADAAAAYAAAYAADAARAAKRQECTDICRRLLKQPWSE